MTSNPKIGALLTEYDRLIQDDGIDCAPVVDVADTRESELKHVRWMIAEVLAHGDRWDPRKVNRWLGFMQGVLWTHGYRGLRELRDETRGADNT